MTWRTWVLSFVSAVLLLLPFLHYYKFLVRKNHSVASLILNIATATVRVVFWLIVIHYHCIVHQAPDLLSRLYMVYYDTSPLEYEIPTLSVNLPELDDLLNYYDYDDV